MHSLIVVFNNYVFPLKIAHPTFHISHMTGLGRAVEAGIHSTATGRKAEMSSGGHSLRRLIDKWFALASGSGYRLVPPPRTQRSLGRCVCFEATGASGALRFFFFRLDDGSWSIYPPVPNRPTLCPD